MAIRRVVIGTPTVTLGALLKWAQVVDSGGAAKRLVQAGGVKVNGVVERRRGRTLLPGDRVAVGGDTLEVARQT